VQSLLESRYCIPSTRFISLYPSQLATCDQVSWQTVPALIDLRPSQIATGDCVSWQSGTESEGLGPVKLVVRAQANGSLCLSHVAEYIQLSSSMVIYARVHWMTVVVSAGSLYPSKLQLAVHA
jgi:hypothetical protein